MRHYDPARVETEARSIVAAFTSMHQLFTAYDVTREVRKRVGTHIRVDHEDVKDHVHQLLQPLLLGSAYRRQHLSLADVDIQPWLYFPSFSDPSSYGTEEAPEDRFASIAESQDHSAAANPVKTFLDSLEPVQAPNLTQVLKNDAPKVQKLLKKGVKKQDKRGRVLVPAKHVREAGFKPGQIAYAVADSGKVVLYKKAPDNFSAMYDVEKGWNVRVSKNVLEQAQLDSKPVSFESETAKIVISA